MTVTLIVNSVASVGFMIISFRFRLLFLLYLASPIHRLWPLISQHELKSLLSFGELQKGDGQPLFSVPRLDALRHR